MFRKFVISQNLECCYSSWLTARDVHGSGLSGFRSGWTRPAIDQICQMVTQNQPNSGWVLTDCPFGLVGFMGQENTRTLCNTVIDGDQIKKEKNEEREREPQSHKTHYSLHTVVWNNQLQKTYYTIVEQIVT